MRSLTWLHKNAFAVGCNCKTYKRETASAAIEGVKAVNRGESTCNTGI